MAAATSLKARKAAGAAAYESNVDNYDSFGQLVDCLPLQLPVYVGMRVTPTRNVQKEQNFVNGMRAVVLAVQRSSVLVQTYCGDVIFGSSLRGRRDLYRRAAATRHLLAAPARVRDDLAKDPGGDPRPHYGMAGRPQHGGRSVCHASRVQYDQILAVPGARHEASLHPSFGSLSVDCDAFPVAAAAM